MLPNSNKSFIGSSYYRKQAEEHVSVKCSHYEVIHSNCSTFLPAKSLQSGSLLGTE